MVDKLGVSNGVHELHLGRSFSKDEQTSFHSFRYDFKPASVDKSKMAQVEIGERNSATVTVPHVEGSGTTVYKGNKRPIQKECVLIIDHQTGKISLEKLSNTLQLKKTRTENSSRPQFGRPSTPVEQVKSKTASKNEHSGHSQSSSQNSQGSSKNKGHEEPDLMSGSSSDSDSSSDDDEEEDVEDAPETQKTESTGQTQQWGQPRQRTTSLLRDDLQLSESGSDSE